MEFSYSQTENFEMEKLTSDTGFFKKTVDINRGYDTMPLGSWTSQVHGFELDPKTHETPKFWLKICVS